MAGASRQAGIRFILTQPTRQRCLDCQRRTAWSIDVSTGERCMRTRRNAQYDRQARSFLQAAELVQTAPTHTACLLTARMLPHTIIH